MWLLVIMILGQSTTYIPDLSLDECNVARTQLNEALVNGGANARMVVSFCMQREKQRQ